MLKGEMRILKRMMGIIRLCLEPLIVVLILSPIPSSNTIGSSI